MLCLFLFGGTRRLHFSRFSRLEREIKSEREKDWIKRNETQKFVQKSTAKLQWNTYARQAPYFIIPVDYWGAGVEYMLRAR